MQHQLSQLVLTQQAHPARRNPEPGQADRDVALGTADGEREVGRMPEPAGADRHDEGHRLADGDDSCCHGCSLRAARHLTCHVRLVTARHTRTPSGPPGEISTIMPPPRRRLSMVISPNITCNRSTSCTPGRYAPTITAVPTARSQRSSVGATDVCPEASNTTSAPGTSSAGLSTTARSSPLANCCRE